METALLQSSADQSISPYKNMRGSKRNHRPLISRPFKSVGPSEFSGGILHAPPRSLSFPYPPPIALLTPQLQQPPLLPLPIPKLNNNTRSKGLSCPPVKRKINNRSRDQSASGKKSEPSVTPKKVDSKQDSRSTATTVSPGSSIVSSAKPLGPDPKDLPKDATRVLSSSVSNHSDLEKMLDSMVFTLSPPPSSLPLPTFSLRPKLSCKAEAAGVNAGASDDLRRILRLR